MTFPTMTMGAMHITVCTENKNDKILLLTLVRMKNDDYAAGYSVNTEHNRLP
jgi:hypothetical protein